MNKMQLGTAEETTYGTPVTVDRFYEFLPGETLERQQEVLMSEGLRPSIRTALGARRVLTRRWGAGSLSMEVSTTTFGRWFKHMLGSATVSQDGTFSSYTHMYTPGDLRGKSLTVQKGVEKNDETAQAFTFHGVKIPSWELSVTVDGLAVVTLELDAEDVDDTTALASASYGTLKQFHFAQAVLKKDGATVSNITDATVRQTTPLNTERWHLGTDGLKAEPLESGLRELGGDLSAEFANQTDFYNAFEADSSHALILEFEGDVISGTFTELLRVTLADVRFEGETPKVDGPAFAVQNVPFSAYQSASGDSVTLVYRTSDAAV